MKKYELSVLFQPELEAVIDTAAAKVKKLVEDNGGSIVSEENDGKKRLAYPIKGQDFAIFYFYVVELPPAAPAKISSVLNISEEAIRYLLVAEDERKAKYEARMAARKQKEDNNKEEE